MIKKLLPVIFLLALVFCSCRQEQKTSSQSLIPVVISLNHGEKAIDVQKMSELAVSYQYKAQSEAADCVGATDEWTSLSVSNETAYVGNFSQGKWNFYVRSLDSDSNVLYEGNSSVYLSGSEQCVVSIYMVKKSNGGSGTVSIEIRCPAPDSASYTLSAKYKKVDDPVYSEKTDFTSSKTGSEVVFTGSLTLGAGSYEFNFTYFRDNVQAGGETVAFDVAGGKSQILSGSITSRIDSVSGLAINKDPGSQIIAVGSDITFVWQSNGTSKTYRWFVNDEEIVGCTTASYTFSENTGGEYTVKCVTSDSETSSCTVRVCYPISVSFDNLVALCENASYICKGFKPSGKDDDEIITSYPYETLYSISESYSSLEEIGLEPVIVSYSEALSAETIIIGKNAEVSTSSSRNWFGQRTSSSKAGFTTVYIFKDPVKYCVTGINTLKNIYVMEGITTLPDYAFYHCTALENISLPSTLTSIGSYCFQTCKALKEIFIPKKVLTMGQDVFYDCSALTKITCPLVAQPSGWNTQWKRGCSATGPFV